MSKFFQIAMDGPAGAGKSTIAKELANRLNFTFINSGGIFRSIAVAAVKNNIDPLNMTAIENLLDSITVTQKGDDMHLNGENISNIAWTPAISAIVPQVAQIKKVRKFVEESQRRIAMENDIVVEGRDTTTIIFPEATLKCWIFASPEIRAQRRWEQNGKKESYDSVLASVTERDKFDSERVLSPMKHAPDAFDVDTTYLSIAEACEKILNEFYKRTK